MKLKLTALFLTLIILTALFVSCTPGTGENTSNATDTSQMGETTAPAETEAPPPEDDLTSQDAVISSTFVIKKPVTEAEVKTDGDILLGIRNVIEIKGTYSSTFYGAKSAVNRASHHLGDLFRATKLASEFPESGYYCGDFNGDIRSELLTFNDGMLKIYTLKGKYDSKLSDETLVFSQKLAFKGKLCGTGDFNNDGFADIMFYSENGRVIIGYGKTGGFTYESGGVPKASFSLTADMMACGDINGDGKADIIAVDGLKTASWTTENGKATLYADKVLNVADNYKSWCIADINNDGLCDLVVIKEAEGGKSDVCTYFGRIDGQFGPYEDEIGNDNVYPTYHADLMPGYITGGDMNKDGVSDIIGVMTDPSKGTKLAYYMLYPTEAPAYDYSSHLIKTDNGYILYNGGLYVDFDNDTYKASDGDHVLVYTSTDGIHWHRNLDAPAFYLGGELGKSGEWWCGNTIEPEVIYVNGTYYMFYQCEDYTKLNGTLIGADKIGYATSTDGLHFERHTEAPVIKNAPEYSSFHHQEVIYVANDPDGKCFWMYVNYVFKNNGAGFRLIRSADPSSFDFENAENVSGLEQIGNQIGYVKLDDGNLLFMRITFTNFSDSNGSRSVPMIQFSRDGRVWKSSNMLLAGVDMTFKQNRDAANCYFLGFSTINGTGEIERLADGSYHFLYAACTSGSSVAPAIFYSDVGLGECTFKVDVTLK